MSKLDKEIELQKNKLNKKKALSTGISPEELALREFK